MTVTAKRVPVPEPQPEPPFRVVLEMDRRDAAVLRRVCNAIGGHHAGPRGAVDRIAEALESVGVEPMGQFRLDSRALYFTDAW